MVQIRTPMMGELKLPISSSELAAASSIRPKTIDVEGQRVLGGDAHV